MGLQEVFRRCLAASMPEQLDWTALDVGAAPGGWTAVLALARGCKKVIAIDPGQLSQDVLDLQRVEDCVDDLLSRSTCASIIVCDMNCSPRQSVDAVLALSPIVSCGACVVITMKNFVGSK